MSTSKSFFLILFLFNLQNSYSQVSQVSSVSQITFNKNERVIPQAGITDISKIKFDFFPTLELIEAPHPGGFQYHELIQKIKSKEEDSKPTFESDRYKGGELESPKIGISFTANQATGIPNDNSIAFSNDGWMVSVVNSTVYMINVNSNDTIPTEISLSAFSESLGTYYQSYDPRILYDHLADRFILLFLNGFSSDKSNVIVAFSQSNNPTDKWNLYKIPGNPFDNEKWTDYPMMAINEKELFVSVNLIEDNKGWMTGFAKTIIWQIDKFKAYDGDENLNIMLWDQNYTENEMPIRNAIPVKGGMNLLNSNQYFLSNRNFSERNDSIFLIELTNSLGQSNTAIKVDILKSNVKYGLPAVANQKGSPQNLMTNDARILGAFIENNQIHFVSTTSIQGSGRTGIYHGNIKNISDVDIDLTGQIISDDQLNFAYPNLSFSGQAPEDDQFILTFGHASQEDYPGHSMIFYNKGLYSNVEIVKKGENCIGDSQQVGNKRWGDYTGSQMQHNKLGVIWTSGTYGKSNTSRGTWIAQVISPETNFLEELNTNIVNLTSNITNNRNKISTYPNPTRENVYIEFELTYPLVLDIGLYNIQGELITNILNKEAQAGINKLKISTNSLSSGIYFLRIANNTTLLTNRKIIIQ